MKRILLVLTGGTICAENKQDKTLGIAEYAGLRLKENFLHSDSAFASDVTIDLTDNLNYLSEDNTHASLQDMKNVYLQYVGRTAYDGVIFAHGTDSLAYSAALFSILLNNTPIPVFFVSGNEPLDSPRTNGNDNFRFAVECICRGIVPNVYVAYKNTSDEKMYLHLASRLKQCANYSEDFFSDGAICVEDGSEEAFRRCFAQLTAQYPACEKPCAFPHLDSVRLSDCVLYLQPYVGMNYNAYDYDRFKAIFHGTFHSGTACAEQSRYHDGYGESSVLRMIDICADKDIDLYLAPAKLQPGSYGSLKNICEHVVNNQKMRLLYGMTLEMTYVKLLLAYSNFTSEEDIEKFLHTEFNYEYIAR